MKIKRIMLWAVLVTAFCAGIWFFVSPSFNRQADLEQQYELMDSILTAMPPYVIVESEIETPVYEDEASIAFDDDNAADDSEYGEHGEHGTENLYSESDEPETESENETEVSDAPPLEPLNQADFPSGIIPIGILTIDSIDLRLPVMEGVKEPELRIAPGRVPQTANVGEIGNAVIAGHRNFTFGSMFNRLGEVENGDIIGFQAMSGEIMTFEVFEILEITPDNQIAFIQPKNESIITLYTCTPIREATYRLLIRARKIEGGL